MNLIGMQLATDCGPIAMANLSELLGLGHAPMVYRNIMENFGFPKTEGLADDLWDSPSRHFEVLKFIFGKEPKVVSTDFDGPKVVLLRLSTLCYHWVTVVDKTQWHDGHRLLTANVDERFSNNTRVLAYSLVDSGSQLPWYWSLWYLLTKAALKILT